MKIKDGGYKRVNNKIKITTPEIIDVTKESLTSFIDIFLIMKNDELEEINTWADNLILRSFFIILLIKSNLLASREILFFKYVALYSLPIK